MAFSSNFTIALVERALQAEMAEHLGHNKQAPVTNSAGNARNGKTARRRRVSLANCRLKSHVTVKPALNHH